MNKIDWLPGLLGRLTIAAVFIPAGWGKLNNLDRVISFFGSLGIPAPQIQAPFVAGMELVCGLLILLGLFTRLASLPLIGIMGVAIVTAKAQDIAGPLDLAGITEFLYIVVLVWLAIKGPGSVSIDRLRGGQQRHALLSS